MQVKGALNINLLNETSAVSGQVNALQLSNILYMIT